MRMEMKKVARMSVVVLALLSILFGTVGALNAKTLKGGVMEQNLRLQPKSDSGRIAPGGGNGLRITRAAKPLEGSAVDASAFAQPLTAQSDPLKAGVVDDNAFAQPPKSFDIGAERNSREMVLAWEKWHRQLSEAIYTRWQRIARDAGKATLRVTITRDRHIMARILRSDGGPEFDSTIMEAVESLDGNPGLTFPAKSQRAQVSFEADYIAASHVKPGFSWVKNDYERVQE